MPKLPKNTVEYIRQLLQKGEYKNCTEIADDVRARCGEKVSRRTISDINIGKSHYDDNLIYPINKKYARNFLTVCCICGEKATGTYQGKEYCHKHYMQMYHCQEILDYSIYDRNEFVQYATHAEIILKNKYGEEVARTKIDLDDLSRTIQYKWYCHEYENFKQYCQGTLNSGEKIRLHHFILGIQKNTLQGKVVDHINGDSLDNRKANLRIITQQENLLNMKPQDPMKGIRLYYLKDGTPRYGARITYNYKTISLGTYSSLEEAQQARKKALNEIRSNK